MADNSNRVAGTAYLAVDGVTFPLVGAFEYDPGNVERESAPGMDGVHGYIEKPAAPSIKGTIRDGHGLRVGDLNTMTNVTVVCELANGKFVTGSNMWSVGRQSSKAEDGTIEVAWEGFQGSVQES